VGEDGQVAFAHDPASPVGEFGDAVEAVAGFLGRRVHGVGRAVDGDRVATAKQGQVGGLELEEVVGGLGLLAQQQRVGLLPDLPELRQADDASVRRWAVKKHLATLDGRQLADLLAMLLVAEELSNNDQLEDLEAYSNFAVALAADLCVSTDDLQAQAEVQAAEQIQAEEDNRLGRNAAGEAFAAAQGAEAAHA